MKKRTLLKSIAGILLLMKLIGDTPVIAADQPDPTEPSQAIIDRLRSHEITEPQPPVGSAIAKNDLNILPMRLKGIVLSDAHHGTAIIEYNRAAVFKVPLRRADSDGQLDSVVIGGIKFAVIDFSVNDVVLRCLATNQLVRVH